MYPKLRRIVRNTVLMVTFAAFSTAAHAANIKVLSYFARKRVIR